MTIDTTQVSPLVMITAAILFATGCSDNYYKTVTLARFTLIHSDDSAYLVAVVLERFYRQNPKDAAKSVVGGWPSTTENFTVAKTIVFKISGEKVVQLEAPGNGSVIPLKDREFLVLSPNTLGPPTKATQDEVFVILKDSLKAVDENAAKGILAQQLSTWARHYKKYDWNYIDTSEVRRVAERNGVIDLKIDGQHVAVELSKQTSSGGGYMVSVKITSSLGKVTERSMMGSLPAKTISSSDWTSAVEDATSDE